VPSLATLIVLQLFVFNESQKEATKLNPNAPTKLAPHFLPILSSSGSHTDLPNHGCGIAHTCLVALSHSTLAMQALSREEPVWRFPIAVECMYMQHGKCEYDTAMRSDEMTLHWPVVWGAGEYEGIC